MMNLAKRTGACLHRRLAGALVAVAAGLALTACGSPAPTVPAVDLGQAANSSAAGAPAGGPAPTAPDVGTLDGEYAVTAGEAATARFEVVDGGITVLEATPAAGWRQVEDERRPREIDMTWVRDATVASLDAEIDDGRFDTDIDIDSVAVDGEYTYRVGDAGSVTIGVIGDRVTLVRQEATPGWVATVDEQELAEGEVEIRFRADGAASTVDFDADVDDRELNVDIDSQTGRDYTAPPVR